mmetsp:Transcript_9213/g.10191  ORF Transcript_9213/g.10191 Transcript_9213/m.10191 type:complete len:302 (-) Transcript_9213:81-986(-)
MNSNTDMSSAIQEAIFLNNKGTRSVRECDYDSALQSFTVVIEMLKPLAAIAEDEKDNEEDDNDNDADTVDDTDSSVPLTISFTNKSMDTDTFDDRNDVNDNTTTTPSSSRTSSSASSSSSLDTDLASTIQFGQHFVFRDPVIIPTESIPSASSSSLSKFLMIVMFNVALTFHLHAISLASSSSSSSSKKKTKMKAKKYFAQAKKIYELALKMHLELDDDIDPLFTLALTNNLGLIYRTMKRKDKSTICFQNMFSTMMYLLDSNAYHEQESCIIKECIWDGLLSNAMTILFKHTYEVAAAAA